MEGDTIRYVDVGESERRRFLRRLYAITDGNYSAVRAVDTIASDVGVGSRDGYCIARDLARRGHLRWRGIGVVSVTPAGARGVMHETRVEHRRRLTRAIGARDIATVRAELEWLCETATGTAEDAAMTARSILKTTFRTYIAAENLAPPQNESTRQLWRVVRWHLGIVPASLLDVDVQRALRGLSSVVDGIAAFASARNAHARTADDRVVDPIYGRLAIRAAFTVVTFVLETWAARTKD